ncbi:hypothetical protein CKO28_12985 [Rhodovibrio sodomensis]|uniref:Sulfotransferase n=1 Tax=Rhodovibrio sodomensis TaxID=1088 RepID=A0ABS1DG58_9PROT|nr:hypothetical protein [Rhodovibrio sodomensis]
MYIAANQYSGSTLLAFLLNTHPEIASAGHTIGWQGLSPEFLCSCGAQLRDCPFFTAIRRHFEEAGLPFTFDGALPTKYSISRFDRLDRIVFDNLPKLRSATLERARDRLVERIPGIRHRIEAADRANVTFIEAALDYAGASVYADNSHSPYRARRLAEISTFSVHPVHLVRDVRGIALSTHRNLGWDLEFTALHWVRVQEQIVRVLQNTPSFADCAAEYDNLLVHYEDLCDRPQAVLAKVVRPIGLDAPEGWTSFKSAEHHILGNEMRFDAGTVRKSERWKRELPRVTRKAIEARCRDYARKSRYCDALTQILDPMFGG